MAFAPKVSQHAEAGRPAARSSSNGAARTPPAYGVGFVDRGAARQQLTKQFGSFLAGRVLAGKMSEPEAARALRQYRGTAAGKKDLFFHDNAVAALAAKQKLEASNISVEGYQALADAPELLASGRYKLHANYRKNRVEQLEEQLAEATARARESGMEVVRRAFREKGPMAALDAAKQIASFADDPLAAVNFVRQEEQRKNEAEKRADLLRQAKFTCKKEMYATEEMCDAFFDNVDQRATVVSPGEIEFSDARVSGTVAKDWQLTAQERKKREDLLTPEEKADRKAARDAKKELYQIDALEGAGKAIKTGFYDLFIGMPGDLMTYGSNSMFGTNHAYSSTFGRELSAELAKGEGTDVDRIKAELAKGKAADMGLIQREIDKGHFSAAEREILALELGRGDRDFRKIRGLLEQGKGTDYWNVADMVGKTAVDVGSTILTLVPGAQGVGTMGKVARVVDAFGRVLFVYDTLSAGRAGIQAAAAGDGRGFGQAFGGMLQAPIMKGGGKLLGAGARYAYGRWNARGVPPAGSFDLDDPSLHASRSGDAARPWSQMNRLQRFTTWLGGRNAIERAKALDFDVDAAAERAFGSDMFGEQYIGQISRAEQAAIASGQSVPGPYIHGVRLGNAIEFASETNIPIFGQMLANIQFENRFATVDVGSGGHAGIRGNSFVDHHSLRDPLFVGQNERMAARYGVATNVWDLTDPYALRTWLAHRGAVSKVQAGAAGRYSIADWCFSGYSRVDRRGSLAPLTDWDVRFDEWNQRQRNQGMPAPVAASKAGGGLYMGSEIRAQRIAQIERMEALGKAMDDPRQLRELIGARSADPHAARSASSSVPSPGEQQRRAAVESNRVAALGGRVGKPLDTGGRFLEPLGKGPGSLFEKAQKFDRDFMLKEFPDIDHSRYEILPNRSGRRYNCFAFTLGELSVPVQPKSGRHVLNPNEPFEGMTEMYKEKGYTLAQEAPRLTFGATGKSRIVVYGKVEGGKIVEFTHAAIQEADGMWTSKMGPDGPLVRHAHPRDVQSKTLGEPVAIYER